MKEKILIAVKLLSEEQKKRLAAAVEEKGFQACFADSEEEVLNHVKGVKVIFSSFHSLAAAAPDLKWFCTPYAGVDHYMEPGAFLVPDAVLTNSSGAYGVTISEHVIMVTLELLRQRRTYAEAIAQKKWVRKLPVRSIHGSRILLLGTGDIGQECAKRFLSFSPKRITGVNRHGKKPGEMFDVIRRIDELDELLPETDILVSALPGTAATDGILNKERLAALPDGAVIINVGRGNCIDENALAQELLSGRLSASLDVFQTEPLPDDSPLWECHNLLITPHVAGDLALAYTRDRVIDMFLEDLERYCQGLDLIHKVDRTAGY